MQKFDNRRTPCLEKFNEKSGQGLKEYLDKFEDYCEENVKGDNRYWIGELERLLDGETGKALNSIKSENQSYPKIRKKLLTWFNNMEELRKKKTMGKFSKIKYSSEDSLYLYSIKVENTFKAAYPKRSVKTSSKLIDKFVNTVPKRHREDFKRQVRAERMKKKNGKIKWSTVQRVARLIDVERNNGYTSSESDRDSVTKEIVINIAKEPSPPDNIRNSNSDKRDYQPKWRTGDCAQNPKYGGNYQNNAHNFNRESRTYPKPNTENRFCSFCKRVGHTFNYCYRYKSIKCYVCGGEGHVARNCTSKRNESYNRQREERRDRFIKRDYEREEANAPRFRTDRGRTIDENRGASVETNQQGRTSNSYPN